MLHVGGRHSRGIEQAQEGHKERHNRAQYMHSRLLRRGPIGNNASPADELRNVVVATLIGVIGVVPGMLSLYGQDDAASVVSIVAGALSVVVASSSVFNVFNWVVSN